MALGRIDTDVAPCRRLSDLLVNPDAPVAATEGYGRRRKAIGGETRTAGDKGSSVCVDAEKSWVIKGKLNVGNEAGCVRGVGGKGVHYELSCRGHKGEGWEEHRLIHIGVDEVRSETGGVDTKIRRCLTSPRIGRE